MQVQRFDQGNRAQPPCIRLPPRRAHCRPREALQARACSQAAHASKSRGRCPPLARAQLRHADQNRLEHSIPHSRQQDRQEWPRRRPAESSLLPHQVDDPNQAWTQGSSESLRLACPMSICPMSIACPMSRSVPVRCHACPMSDVNRLSYVAPGARPMSCLSYVAPGACPMSCLSDVTPVLCCVLCRMSIVCPMSCLSYVARLPLSRLVLLALFKLALFWIIRLA
jgi:hypothetical protein